MLDAASFKHDTLQQSLSGSSEKVNIVDLPSISHSNNVEKRKSNQLQLSVVALPQIKFTQNLKDSCAVSSRVISSFPSVASAVSITGLLPHYKQFFKSHLTSDSVKLASLRKRLKKLNLSAHARAIKKSDSPLFTASSTLHRKKLPKLVLCAGDSSSDTSTFEQRSQSFRSSLSQPTKSQSLPGLEKLKQLDYLLSKSTFALSLALSGCNEGMNTSKQQQKRLPQHFERAMRVSEQRSYANLTSSFEVPTVGRVSMSRKPQLRSTKSFHGDAANTIPEVTTRVSHGGDRDKSSMSHSAMLSNGYTLLRSQPNSRKLSERQRSKILKPLSVSKNQANMNKEFGQEFCSAILPDSSTASYRLTHDVSFDEGSRYRGAVTVPFVYKNTEEARDGTLRKKPSYTTSEEQRPSQSSTRIDLISDQSNRRPPTSHIQTLTFKEPISYTFLRSEEKRPSSRVISPHANSPTYCHANSPNGIPILRASKEVRSNWNNKYGDLSISGGNFSGSNSTQPGIRVDPSVLNSVPVNPASSYTQKMAYRSLSREKSVTSPTRPRLSSKSRADSSPSYITACKDCVFADPCVGASPSFHQRLNELSLLEAETIKYEKNRKFKRKMKSDKDS